MQKEFPKNNINRKILYLCLWFAFFIAVSIFVVVNAKKAAKLENNTVNEVETENENKVDPVVIKKNKTTKDFENYKKNLLDLNYAFNYEVTKNGNKVTYNGKINTSKAKITREDSTGIKNLYIENDILYEVVLGEKKLSDVNIDHDNFLDVEYLFSKISKVESNKNNTFILTIEGYTASASMPDDKLIININNEQESYILEFSQVKKISILD